MRIDNFLNRKSGMKFMDFSMRHNIIEAIDDGKAWAIIVAFDAFGNMGLVSSERAAEIAEDPECEFTTFTVSTPAPLFQAGPDLTPAEASTVADLSALTIKRLYNLIVERLYEEVK